MTKIIQYEIKYGLRMGRVEHELRLATDGLQMQRINQLGYADAENKPNQASSFAFRDSNPTQAKSDQEHFSNS